MQKGFYNEYWRSGADTYSGGHQGYARPFLRWMAAEFGSGSVRMARGLEAGCGDGSFTEPMAGYFEEMHAIDIADSQLVANQGKSPNIQFRPHDLGEKLPFPDAYFDGIWCSEVLEHLFDPLYALSEFHRTLKVGGKLLVTVPYHGLFKNVMIALFKWDHHFDPEYPHIRFFTKRTLDKIARKAGFTDIKMSTCGMSQPLRDFFIRTNLLMRAVKTNAQSTSSAEGKF